MCILSLKVKLNSDKKMFRKEKQMVYDWFNHIYLDIIVNAKIQMAIEIHGNIYIQFEYQINKTYHIFWRDVYGSNALQKENKTGPLQTVFPHVQFLLKLKVRYVYGILMSLCPSTRLSNWGNTIFRSMYKKWHYYRSILIPFDMLQLHINPATYDQFYLIDKTVGT